MDRELNITFVKDRNGKPLAIVENFPGLSAELYPEQLRAMAEALNQAAADCENARPQQKNTYQWRKAQP